MTNRPEIFLERGMDHNRRNSIICTMLRAVIVTILLSQLVSATPQTASTWQNSALIKTSTVNEWCRHCPDWNQTSYSFKLDDGMVYVGQTHTKLDVVVNGQTKLRFEKDGHVGDYMHVIDDGGQDKKLKVIQKIAPEQRADQPK